MKETFNKSEKSKLSSTSKLYSSYGTENFSEAETESSKTENESAAVSTGDSKKVSLPKLFRYATNHDKWIIAIGTIFAIVHGAGMPVLAFVFGKMTDVFIQQTLYGFADSHNETQIYNQNKLLFTNTKVGFPESVSLPTIKKLLIDPLYTSPGNNWQESSSETQARTIPEGLLTREEFSEFMTGVSYNYIYIGCVVFLASFIQSVLWEWSCERQVYRLRQEFLYQVLRQEISWYDNRQRTGDLAMKLSDDLERIREGLGHKFSLVIQFAATFLVGFTIGFTVNWQMTLIILAITPLLVGSSAYTGRMISTQTAREQKKYGKAGAIAEEVLSSIKTVASFGGEQREIKRYESRLMDGLSYAIKKYRLFSIGVGIVFFVMFSSYALGFWYGCQLLNYKLVTPGDIFVIFLSVLAGAFSFGNSIPFIAILGTARGSAAVVFEIIDSIPRIDSYSKDGLTPERIIGRIQFKNVNFNYPSRKQVSILQNFTVEIEPGNTVAFVGHSGAGKSTLMSLILRFYDPLAGAILLDGHDLKALNLAWIRHHIGVVSQEPVLFGTTIYENICYGRDYVTPDEVVTASRMANAHDFISSLPQGYETLVGERGAQLSGGQKQRIAIARALVRDPRILLLDEATSALDAKSESLVQEALDKARKGRTTIIIAHRLSTIKDADVIYVMKDGAIAEYGTHVQLMAREELYYDLVAAQMSLESIEEIDAAAEASYCDSTEESYKEYDFEAEKRRRRKGRHTRRQVRVRALPDPDRARMAREVEELDVDYPGFFKILSVNKPETCILIYGFIGCIISGATFPVFSLLYAAIFETFTKEGQELLDDAFFWSMAILVMAVTSGFGHWLRTIFISIAGEYLTMRLRLRSYIAIVRQPVAWFDKDTNSPGRLSTRLARDAPLVKAASGHRLAALIACFVVAIGGNIIALWSGWQLGVILLASYPLVAFAGYMSVQIQRSGLQKDAVMMEDCGRIANEAIQNVRTVQSLTQEKLFFTKYVETLLPVYFEAHKQGIIYGVTFALSEAILFFIYGAAFRYGAYLVEIALMEPVNIYRAFFAQIFAALGIGQILSFIPDFAKAKLAASLIFNLIETKSTIDPFSPEGLRPKIEGRITLSDVKFSYPAREQSCVLHGMSFDLQAGQALALIGPSGCGKSTIVSLLERFYDVSEGQVLIDGYDVRSLNVAHLRKSIGLVTQEPVLFDCTIRENIAYGYTSDNENATHCPESLIIDAAKSANIHNFITGLPQGYETYVGERGIQLSGGQKQRIAIARALIRDPKILLLDEATSALDSESEKIVQEALDKARAGRTCIIIAHRLSTIQNADYIAVINHGRIVEMGTNDQLRARKGLYYKLTKKQQITH